MTLEMSKEREKDSFIQQCRLVKESLEINQTGRILHELKNIDLSRKKNEGRDIKLRFGALQFNEESSFPIDVSAFDNLKRIASYGGDTCGGIYFHGVLATKIDFFIRSEEILNCIDEIISVG
jgi:hypothetical protein